jgi:hypothetical protein
MENRKDKRFGEQNNVLVKDNYLALGTGTNGGINAYTHDISVTGARIRTKLGFPVGYIIRIAIDLKRTQRSLRVDAEVIWTRKSKKGKHFDIGVQFLHSVPDTIILLIAHFYGKQAGIPSSVSQERPAL